MRRRIVVVASLLALGGAAIACQSEPACATRTSCESCLDGAASQCGWCAGICTDGGEAGPADANIPYCTGWVRDPGLCGGAPGETRAELRARGVFRQGDLPGATLDESTAAQGKIRQVIILLQENHSTDNLFGFTAVPDIDSVLHPRSPVPRWAAAPFHLQTSCPDDQSHGWISMHAQWDEGTLLRMAENGSSSMGFYRDMDHPLYTSLALHFGFGDRYFSSVLGSTWPNRDYLYFGTSQGIRDTGQHPYPGVRSIFDALGNAGVDWSYASKNPDPPTGNGVTGIAEGAIGPRFEPGGVDFGHIVPYSSFLAAVDAFDPVRSSPKVWFIDGGSGFDEHPGGGDKDTDHHGEQLVGELLLDHVLVSRGWPATAVLIAYDESGGYFDHVVPPSAPPPDPTQRAFNYLGFRVPLFVISPWVIRGVSHVVHSHTSILRFVEALFDLPALTARDANSDALLDMFDFSGQRSVGTALPPLAPPWSGARCGVSR